MSFSRALSLSSRFRQLLRPALLATLVLAGGAGAFALGNAQRAARTTAGLLSAESRLDDIEAGAPSNDLHRAAIVWGYTERLRLGLESPFRLVEAAARDPRLTAEERRTVSWALLGRVLQGETHEIDAASLDLLGPWEDGRSVPGELHLALIERVVSSAENPRAGELAVRLAYTLASAERLVDGSAPLLAAEAAALIADRELASREARSVVRSTRGADPIAVVRRRRARRAFYVERPTLLAPERDIERDAVGFTGTLLDSIRMLTPVRTTSGAGTRAASDSGKNHEVFAASLYAAGARVPPTAALAVTVQRYLPLMRNAVHSADWLARVRSPEMLVAAIAVSAADRVQRRATGRLMLAAGVSMRSVAQEPIWFEGDSVDVANPLSEIRADAISFDAEIPHPWRPYFLASLAQGMRDARRVFPTLPLSGMRVRFRMKAPADSALAMHDPKTRTLHLPVATFAGTLVHELAHDLDRQNAKLQGLAGYRSDNVARAAAGGKRMGTGPTGRVAASLLALTEESIDSPRRPRGDRPAEIFATRVDWFVASALARQGISNGFLSAVQDETLTGHVIHPDRLPRSGNTRSLLSALEGMTSVAPFANVEEEPSLETLLRWSLAAPVDRRVSSDILRGQWREWEARAALGGVSCSASDDPRQELIRLAAESRARGWLRLRARWTKDAERAGWARSVLRQAPWSSHAARRRAAQLEDHILLQLAAAGELPHGLSAYAASLAVNARCQPSSFVRHAAELW